MPEPDETTQGPPETIPLEAHIVALRAELERTQMALRLASGVLVAVALLLAFQTMRGAGGGEGE